MLSMGLGGHTSRCSISVTLKVTAGWQMIFRVVPLIYDQCLQTEHLCFQNYYKNMVDRLSDVVYRKIEVFTLTAWSMAAVL